MAPVESIVFWLYKGYRDWEMEINISVVRWDKAVMIWPDRIVSDGISPPLRLL